ncbi:N-acetylmannosaminyltransferase [Oceanotoga teriensis]|uniref:N-acetylmannosaminyltransferase n=1 Tax=Oceanotoga teriensis TaxID=515440 RepID=A0AA45C8L4_9BACT|nr:WecB/TagA/CpsF family glycosyltransferase [Oceanotoga teriensis]PWJ96169.1 N-acetylmannosaminyltransferase [Oceanotoga teriensis]
MSFVYNLDGIDMLTGNRDEIIKIIKESINNNEKTWIITLNALMYMEYLNNETYKQAIKKANYSIPDGIGIVKYLRKRGVFSERCTGIDTMKEICDYSSKNKLRIFLLGSKENYVFKATEKIEEEFGVKVSGYSDGFFDQTREKNIVDKINESKADVLFVGMGIPKQEDFILRNIDNINCKFFMGVGGSIDVFSGEMKRAPVFYQKIGAEWLYRMIVEPKRFKKLPELFKFYSKIYFKR